MMPVVCCSGCGRCHIHCASKRKPRSVKPEPPSASYTSKSNTRNPIFSTLSLYQDVIGAVPGRGPPPVSKSEDDHVRDVTIVTVAPLHISSYVSPCTPHQQKN
eukprot:1818736-Rhodomonas_salina.1